jgi:ParB-like chromosome segregation protein Spo0J
MRTRKQTPRRSDKQDEAGVTGGGSKVRGAHGVSIPEAVMLPLEDINLAEYNPRFMPKEMMTALKASLRKHGLVVNLVVQKQGMVLIGGHQRLRALRDIAKEDGFDMPLRVPAVVLDLADAEAKKLNVSLNNIEGEFDPYRLCELFASIKDDLSLDDIVATGFTSLEVDRAIALTMPVDEQIASLQEGIGAGAVDSFARTITLPIVFETVEQRDKAKELLHEIADSRGQHAAKVLLAALKKFQASNPAAASNGGRPRTRRAPPAA